MEFNPSNNVVQLCIQGMAMEEKGKPEEASQLFLKAWNEATNDFEKFIAAHYVARHQKTATDRLKWYQTALQFVLSVDNDGVKGAYASLYMNIARCYEELGDLENAKRNNELAALARHKPADKGPFYHGTKADLKVGDLLTPGRISNYKAELQMNHIYFTALANGAGLAASLAKGDEPERVYIVEPTGDFENDPNVTDKKFPGNPTRSYRTAEPLKIVGELTDWVRQTPEDLQKWRERLAQNTGEIIN
jgi:tetratricopeptide (TPR) repeat protein